MITFTVERVITFTGLRSQRGKVAKSDAHNLCEHMRKHESAVLLFAKNPHVAFTNNRAERDLRMSKVKLVFDSGKIKSIVNQQVNRRRKSLSLHTGA